MEEKKCLRKRFTYAIFNIPNGIKPFDLLMWRENDVYEACSANPKGIENTILKEGVLLYG